MPGSYVARRIVVAATNPTRPELSFADERTLFSIPNFWNVVSNFPFIAVGAAGLRQFYRDPATLALFLGIFLTGFSSYYHWNTNNDTLFWDRLPMTLCFMAILAIVVEERVKETPVSQRYFAFRDRN